MHILAIETTGPKCSVAVADADGVIAEIENSGKFAHLSSLMPMVSDLLTNCQLTIKDITAIAVSAGPGSFTGIRIGVTTARALAQALDIPAVAVPTLRSFVYADPGCTDVICPLFDARRSEVYAAAYLYEENGNALEIVPGGAYPLAEYLKLLFAAAAAHGRKSLVFYGDGTGVYGADVTQAAAAAGFAAEIRDEVQQASYVATLGLELYRAGKAVPYGLLKPDYMRESEAKRQLKLKQENATKRCE